MIVKRWRLILAILTVAMCLAPVTLSTTAQAQQPPPLCDSAGRSCDVFKNVPCTGSNSRSPACQVKDANPLTGTNSTIAKVTRIIAFLAGLTAVLLIIIGGFMYVLSGGDSSKISTAKHTVIYALIGLVIVISAQTIIVFILNRL